ncbi:transposase family protein [Streptomyces chartreusis]|uniref:transposase family protein n=1 Tax=Streptomyces chartreusis TaxID=1969 RepID=UPI0035D82971
MSRPGRPWSLPLEDRVLLVVTYWRTNLTLRQLAPLSGPRTCSAGEILAVLADHVLQLRQGHALVRDFPL